MGIMDAMAIDELNLVMRNNRGDCTAQIANTAGLIARSRTLPGGKPAVTSAAEAGTRQILDDLVRPDDGDPAITVLRDQIMVVVAARLARRTP